MSSTDSVFHEDGSTITAHGKLMSPIKPTPSAERLHRAPSKTFIPSFPHLDIMDYPQVLSSRIKLDLRLSSPIFLGGATAEGMVRLTIDGGKSTAQEKKQKPSVFMGRIAVLLVGIERSNSRRAMFRCLMSNLLDEANPPPETMTTQQKAKPEYGWEAIPSMHELPFQLDIPCTPGPAPYVSKRNSIYYLVSVLVEARVGGEQRYVRKSEKVDVLTVYDRR